MRTGRGWAASFAIGAVLIVAATAGTSVALAETANLEFDPPSYDFGGVPYADGPTDAHEFTLTNTGGIQLTIKRWRSWWGSFWPEAPDPFGVTSSDCHTLEPGESCSISIVFDPIHPGAWHGGERLKSQIEEEPWAELDLRGEGTGPWIPVTPSHIDFGSVPVGTITAPETVTLESQDPKSVTFEKFSFTSDDPWSPAADAFQIVGGSCQEGGSLAPGKTCTIEVVMHASAVGPLQATLEIFDAADDSPQSVELEGSVTAAPAEAQPIAAPPTVTVPPKRLKRACRKGKRRVVRKGRRLCVNKRRHHRRH